MWDHASQKILKDNADLHGILEFLISVINTTVFVSMWIS